MFNYYLKCFIRGICIKSAVENITFLTQESISSIQRDDCNLIHDASAGFLTAITYHPWFVKKVIHGMQGVDTGDGTILKS